MRKLSEKKKKWIERTVAKDRSYKVFLNNRFILFALLVLGQLIFSTIFLYLLTYDSSAAIIIQIIMTALSLIFVLYLINKNERPSVRLNWILMMIMFPFVGVPMFLLFGEGRPTKWMAYRIQKEKKKNETLAKKIYGEEPVLVPQNRGESLSLYLSKYGKYPLYKDGTLDYYKSGEEMFPVMMEELQKAEKYILLDYFIIAHGKMWNSILKVLVEKAIQGVQVRIIYDDFGCMMTLPPRYEEYLESLHENIKCLNFNKVVPIFTIRMNNRDHRKILGIDGKVAFTGGINLADEYIAEKVRFGYWKDSGVKVTGNAVRSFTQMFFYMWNAFYRSKEDVESYLPTHIETEEDSKIRIQPYDDSPLDNISIGEGAYSDMINRAQNFLYIFTPYLFFDDSMRTALCQAALRGVDVRIVTPSIPDKKLVFRLTRANYDILLKAGVKIYEYTPGFIHAKSMLCDGEWAVVGTINLDYRSLYFHFENAVYFSGCDAINKLELDCKETFAVSKECTLGNTKRGFFGQLFDSLLRIFETLV